MSGYYNDFNYNAGNYNEGAVVVSVGNSLALDRLYLHVVDTEGLSSNALFPISLLNPPGQGKDQTHHEGAMKFKGRRKPMRVFAEITSAILKCNAIIPRTESSTLTNLAAIIDARRIVCARDQMDNIIFGRIQNWQKQEHDEYWSVAFDVVESEYDEEV